MAPKKKDSMSGLTFFLIIFAGFILLSLPGFLCFYFLADFPIGMSILLGVLSGVLGSSFIDAAFFLIAGTKRLFGQKRNPRGPESSSGEE